MSFLVWVYCPDSNGELTDHHSCRLTYQRSLRKTLKGGPGINIRGKVFPVYKSNFLHKNQPTVFFNPHEDPIEISTLDKEKTPILSEKEAESVFNLDIGSFGEILTLQDHDLPKDLIKKDPKALLGADSKTTLNLDFIPKFTSEGEIEPLYISNETNGEKEEIIELKPKIINLNDQISFPVYGNDWLINRMKFYNYVVFNDDEFSKLQQVLSILRKPEDFALLDSFAMTGFGRPDETYAFEAISNSRYKVGVHKNFKERYGEFDFLSRPAEKKSSNNIKYDYWVRFSLSLKEDYLKSLFEDLFKIIAVSNYFYNDLKIYDQIDFSKNLFNFHSDEKQTSFSDNQNNQNNQENVIDENLSLKTEIQTQKEELKQQTEKIEKILELLHETQISDNDEIASEVNKENAEVREKIIELKDLLDLAHLEIEDNEIEIKNLNRSIHHLKKSNEKLTSRAEDGAEELLINLLPQFIFLERGLKIFKTKFTDQKPLIKVLSALAFEKDLPIKKINKTNNWYEVDKKISNGQDDQGRVYFTKIEKDSTLQKAILIGYKQNQETDFNYLSENDNFDL